MKKVSILFAVMVTVFAWSCKKDAIATVDCTGSTPTYGTPVKKILDSYCATAGCHAATNPADGLDFSSYGQAKINCAKDNFRGSIQHLSGYDAMPKGGNKLSDTDIKALNCWVQNGMPQ